MNQPTGLELILEMHQAPETTLRVTASLGKRDTYIAVVHVGDTFPKKTYEHCCNDIADLGKITMSVLLLAWANGEDILKTFYLAQNTIAFPCYFATEVQLGRKRAKIWMCESGQTRVMYENDPYYNVGEFTDTLGDAIMLKPIHTLF